MKLIEVSNSEIRVFLNWLYKPTNFFSFVWHIFRLGQKKLSSHGDQQEKVAPDEPFNNSLRYFDRIQKGRLKPQKNTSDVMIPLAGIDYRVDRDIEWICSFADREDYSALHRFGWLNKESIFFTSCELGFSLIESWIKCFHHNKDDFAYQSYNIAERLLNWTYFINRWCDYGFPDDETKTLVTQSMRQQLYILANDLERYGEYTNNHLVNDGRGLYIVGYFLNEPKLVEIGRECLRFGIENLISSTGLLKEHSTHYHILLTKNYLETLLIAQELQDDFQQELEPVVLKMLHSSRALCWNSTNRTTIPLIGDISPDASPEWVSSVLSVLEEGYVREADESDILWSDLWELSSSKLWSINAVPSSLNGTFQDNEAGFFLIHRNGYDLCIHNPVSEDKSHFAHFHFDDLSFTLMINGIPIVQDPGRPNYIKSHLLGLYARLPQSHNTVFLQGHAISSHNLKLFPRKFYTPAVSIRINERDSSVHLTLEHSGFKRIDERVTFRREFCVSDSDFSLEDRWTVGSNSELTTRFHLSHHIDKVTRHNNNLLLACSESGQTFKFDFEVNGLLDIRILKGVLGQQPETCAGWSFPQYGSCIPSFTIDFVQQSTNNTANRFKLSKTN